MWHLCVGPANARSNESAANVAERLPSGYRRRLYWVGNGGVHGNVGYGAGFVNGKVLASKLMGF